MREQFLSALRLLINGENWKNQRKTLEQAMKQQKVLPPIKLV